jgi:hypothetical protein
MYCKGAGMVILGGMWGVGSWELGARIKTAGSGELGNRLNETFILRSIATGVLMAGQAVCQLIGDWQMLGKILGDLACARDKPRLVCR